MGDTEWKDLSNDAQDCIWELKKTASESSFTVQHYRNSLSSENEGISLDRFVEYKKIKTERQDDLDKMLPKGEQTKLSAFFDY